VAQICTIIAPLSGAFTLPCRKTPLHPNSIWDIRILQCLTRDGRMSWRDLAEEIGLSLTPTIRRVRQLEAAGLITGYFARLDERAWPGR
jgi:DNA-binding Lrp family transcriptional regulator